MPSANGAVIGATAVARGACTGHQSVPEPSRHAFSKVAREALQADLSPIPVECEFAGARFNGYVFTKPGQSVSFGEVRDLDGLKADVSHPCHKSRVCDVFFVKTEDQRTFRLSLSSGGVAPTLVALDMNSGIRHAVPLPEYADLTLTVGGSLRFVPDLGNSSIQSVWGIENRGRCSFYEVAKPHVGFRLQGRRLDGVEQSRLSLPVTVEEAPISRLLVDRRVATGFKTAKGSTYQIEGDGSTIRNKAERNDIGHEGDFGVKPRSAKTIYVDTQAQAIALSGAGMESPFGKGFHVLLHQGKATLLWGAKQGGWTYSRSSREIPFSEKPQVGAYPVELWKPQALEGLTAEVVYSGQHAGNRIVEVTYAEDPDPAASTSNQRHSRYDRSRSLS